jgi:type II secretory pathway component PulF
MDEINRLHPANKQLKKMNENETLRKLDLMQLNELSLKDADCLEILEEAARKARLIAAKKGLRYGQPLSEVFNQQTTLINN